MTFGHGVFDSFGADSIIFNAAPTSWRQPSAGARTNAPSNCGGGDKPTYTIYQRTSKINGKDWIIDYTEHDGTHKSRLEGSLASAKASAANPPGGFQVPSGYWIDMSNNGTQKHGSAPSWTAATAVDGTANAWGEWTECVGGKKTRSRTSNPPSCGGTPFSGIEDEEASCCSDPNGWEHTDGSCKCNDGYEMGDDGVCQAKADDTTDDSTTDDSTTDDSTTDDGTTDTSITAQSTTVTPVVATSSGMSGTMKGLLAVGVLGGGFLYMKSKKGKKPIA